MLYIESNNKLSSFYQFSQYAGLFDDVHQDYPNLFKKVPESMQLFLKLENCQTTGSFKIRGVASQLHAAKRILAKQGIRDMKELKLITMSAGNTHFKTVFIVLTSLNIQKESKY